MTPFEKKILLKIPADYSWSDEGIVRIGASEDIAAYTVGDFRGYCLIFCHGNGETAVSERYWFEQLAKAGVSVICPDYRGYGLSEGVLSEQGCYTAAHAAYEWLVDVKRVSFKHIAVLGYSLGSAVAVELAATVSLASLILQTPFLDGASLRSVTARLEAGSSPACGNGSAEVDESVRFARNFFTGAKRLLCSTNELAVDFMPRSRPAGGL